MRQKMSVILNIEVWGIIILKMLHDMKQYSKNLKIKLKGSDGKHLSFNTLTHKMTDFQVLRQFKTHQEYFREMFM